MFRALADGEDRHRLEDEDGRNIGWIVRRAIGFQGFATEARAMHAALDSWRALEAALNREYAGRPKLEVLLDELRIVREGSKEWISDGRIRLARLHRRNEGHDGESTFAIELRLPSYATEGVAIAAAHVLGRAVYHHLTEAGVRETNAEVMS